MCQYLKSVMMPTVVTNFSFELWFAPDVWGRWCQCGCPLPLSAPGVRLPIAKFQQMAVSDTSNVHIKTASLYMHSYRCMRLSALKLLVCRFDTFIQKCLCCASIIKRLIWGWLKAVSENQALLFYASRNRKCAAVSYKLYFAKICKAQQLTSFFFSLHQPQKDPLYKTQASVLDKCVILLVPSGAGPTFCLVWDYIVCFLLPP